MSKKQSGVNYSKSKKVVDRRIRVIESLRKQLAGGTKPEKVNGRTLSTHQILDDNDIYRIKREIEILQSRI